MGRAVYLVRHTTPAVDAGVCYGATDLLLDAQAFRGQLQAIHAQLPDTAQLIASPLLRCARLAQALVQQASARRLRFDARLAEMNFGHWERKPWDVIARHEIDAWAANFWHYAGHGGESVHQLKQRVLAAWQAHKSSESPVVFITHAGPMQIIDAHVHARDLGAEKRRKVAYGEVICLDI